MSEPIGAQPTGPLRKGLRVFDLTRVLAGPTCAQMLADLGADVIKIERPGAGDDTRGFAPPYMPGTKESAYFVGVNRNKRSVTLDIAQPEGQAIARQLIAQCDILVENFKVGALAKYGLGYEELHAKFPRLIYCSITGFGQTGPYAPRPGYDSADPGDGRRDEPDRRAGRAAAEGRRAGRRPVRRAVRLHRHPGRAAPSRRDRAGPADRYRHAGYACRVAGEPGHELPGDRREPARGWATSIRTSCRIRCSRPRTATSCCRSATIRRSSGSARRSR